LVGFCNNVYIVVVFVVVAVCLAASIAYNHHIAKGDRSVMI